ncbi:MAG: fumarate reductase subunit D [Dehalococcoidia bacterium]|nr:fumarate reductase subunit D [Dehalococcoidia bacterium]
MRYSNEPLFWSLFSAGGMLAALLLPVLIVLTGFVLPADEIAFSHLQDIFSNALIRLVLFALAFLVFMHWANRFRHTLVDMGLKSLHTPISVLSYVVAIAGTAWAALVLLG